MAISAQGLAVIRSFEGRSLKAYYDSVHVITIGYGITNNDTADLLAVTGKSRIVPGMTITEEQAEELLQRAISRKYAPPVDRALAPAAPSQGALDAGYSFHYNTGAIARASWVKSLVAKNLPEVHSRIMQWNKAGGQTLAGLTRRRNREWLMISKGDYGPEGRTAPVDLTTLKPVKGSVDHPGMLKPGDAGPEIVDLQRNLKAAGLTKAEPTGTFDAATVAAVDALQKAHPRLGEDGVVGPATKAAVQRITDFKSKSATRVGGILGTGTLAGAVDNVVSGMSDYVWVGLGVAAIVILGYTAWSYRDEIRALLTRK